MQVNLDSDSQMTEIFEKILSGCLPHQNYKPEMFRYIYSRLTTLFQPEEFKHKYYVFMKIFQNLSKMASVIKGFNPQFSKDILDRSLQSSAYELVNNPDVGMEEWLQNNGLDSNLNIPQVVEQAASKLYSNSIELYDRLYEMATPTDEALSLLIIIRDMLKSHLIENSVRAQVEILNSDYIWQRKVYTGPDGWLSFTNKFKIYLESRLAVLDTVDDVVVVDNIGTHLELLEQSKQLYKPLFKLGLKPVDDITPITQHSLVVVVGEEGVGKTQMAINIANSIKLIGKDVIYMCGESHKSLVTARLQANYMYKTRGYKIDSKVVASKDEFDEETQRVINAGILDYVKPSNGTTIMLGQFTYQNFEQEVDQFMEKYPNTGAIIVDHSRLLKSVGNSYGKNNEVTVMAEWTKAVINVKNKYPIAVIVLSHPSSGSKKDIQKGNRPSDSPTAGASALAQGADYVFIFAANEELKRQGLIAISSHKIRNFESKMKPFIVETDFRFSGLIYNEKLQEVDKTRTNDVIDRIAETLDDEDNDNNDFEILDEEINL